MNRTTRWSLTIPFAGLACYWTLCFLLTHIPMSGLVKSQVIRFPHQDKVAHFVLYAGLAWLMVWFLEEWTRRPFFARYAAVVLAFAYGGIDEWLQSFIPSRSMDGWDWVADGIGALMGVAAYSVFKQLTSRRTPAQAAC